VAEAEALVVAAVRAAVAEAAREAEVAEAVGEAAVAVAVQAEAVDLAVVVEVAAAAAAAGALAAEHLLLPNRQARAPELLVKVVDPRGSTGSRLLLVGISH
jgi:hypothetical protein